MKKLFYLITAALYLVACEGNTPDGSINKDDYVDLGLQSGTLWKNANEINPNDEIGLYTYDEAISLFKKNMPNKAQWMELINECTWEWTGSGYKVAGPNGKSITLPAAGYRYYDGSMDYVGSHGFYWSYTSDGSVNAQGMYFHSGGVYMGSNNRHTSQSIRLVN